MPGIPVLKPREVIAILSALGFVEARQRGSHKQFRHEAGPCQPSCGASGRLRACA